MTLGARHVAVAGTIITLGLVALVGIATILGPGKPGGAVIGSTGRPETTRPIAPPLVSSPSPSSRP